ncbi:MAG: GDP-mannose 4,6-dehydratase [Clostridia bacterium]|nr:GDP-mannose 4,6-dehydratase [Clostridia bacterium]
MKILITGGCGFIGSHVADRLFKEGHEIYIIDNLSSGSIENVKVKHRFYNFDIADEECEKVLQCNKVDIVIHLAAQASVSTSLECPYLDTRTNILGTSNMLFLSEKYGVKKFIFASSAAVYGNPEETPLSEESTINPVSPYGMSKYTGEFYCRKWSEIYGLNTLCFRFSNVYGPRQGMAGEGGVISIFIQKILDNQPLTIYGDGNQTRDFIFVEDLVDALYKSLESSYCGTLNLSTNTENNLNGLVQILEGIQPISEVIFQAARDGDILRSRLDNSKIRKILNWDTEYTFSEGIKKTYQWYLSKRSGVTTQ